LALSAVPNRQKNVWYWEESSRNTNPVAVLERVLPATACHSATLRVVNLPFMVSSQE
jgi:hypothetical protein